MNNYWAFLPMRAASELLGDPEALRARLDEDSYLYLPQVIDRDRILGLRERFLGILSRRGWIQRDYGHDAVSVILPLREGEDAYLDGYDELQRLEALHSLAHDEALLDVMRQVVGPTAFPHPLKIVRMSFPENYEVSTPPHQDFPNNQGTPNLVASWIPLGDVPMEMGPLAILRGSHAYGVLPLDVHPGAGNRQAVLPIEMLEELRWVTTDFRAGDVLLFGSKTVHASLNNGSDAMRLSVDFRFQPEGEPLTPIVLEPHFQRQTWDDVYADWESTRYQYYWRDLDYEVVPFEEFPLVTDVPEDPPWAEIIVHDRRLTARHGRRLSRLGLTENVPADSIAADAEEPR
jgi:ectoine hydroxylase-related dioxygenase (phytanoyl-CoA dioxygenase family)